MDVISSKRVLYKDKWYLIEWDDYTLAVNEIGAGEYYGFYISRTYLDELTKNYCDDNDYFVRQIYTAILMRASGFAPERQEEFLRNWDGDLDTWVRENISNGGHNNV